MLCLSPYATLKLVDGLGSNFDKKVNEWRDILLQKLEATINIEV